MEQFKSGRSVIMRKQFVALQTAALLLFVAAAASAQANTGNAEAGTVFYVNDPVGRNSVSFSSKAPLEDIVGTTNRITGHIVFDPARGAEGGKGSFSVPVESLNTGIPLRDEHLKGSDWLDAAGHPEISFKFDETRDAKLVKSSSEYQTYDATLVGDFSMRGRTVRIEVPARFTYIKQSDRTRQRMPGDLIAGRATFSVALADFGVQGPAGMDLIGTKVSDRIDIQVSFVATSVAPEGS
jgi:polyisoprenoid-binding protein YceI